MMLLGFSPLLYPMGSKPMKILHHGHQTTTKVLTRSPMNDRLYHVNYNTLKSKEGIMSQLNRFDPKEKCSKKQIMKNAWRGESNLYASFEIITYQNGWT
jgi:hypothetical protein